MLSVSEWNFLFKIISKPVSVFWKPLFSVTGMDRKKINCLKTPSLTNELFIYFLFSFWSNQ